MSTCTELEGIAGPFTHTLFLGGSVSSFDASLGWNTSSSELQVQLAHDPCGGEKTYYDGCGNPTVYNAPDFINPPTLGSPVYFQFGNFSFCGILNNWKKNKTDGSETVSVVVKDPTEILDGTCVILGGYNGSVGNVPNLINVYGFLEQWNGSLCPIDPTLAAMLSYEPAFGFGGAKTNEAGISWNYVRNALNLIINSTPMLYNGKFGGGIMFRDHVYYLDLSAIPYTLDDYRFNGETTTLLNIIDEVCRYGGLDWYCEIIVLASGAAEYNCDTGVGGAISNDMAKFIKIRTVSRAASAIPAADIDVNTDLTLDERLGLGTINSVVQSVKKNTYQQGLELRNDVSNAVVVGDKRQDIWQVDYLGDGTGHNDSIWPYWGKDRNGRVIVGSGYGAYHQFNISLSGVVTDYTLNLIGDSFAVTHSQIFCALENRSLWDDRIEIEHPEWFDAGFIENTLKETKTENFDGWRFVKGKGKCVSIQNTRRYNVRKGASNAADDNESDLDRIYRVVHNYASEFYGKKFMVDLPITCYTKDLDTPFQRKLNWEVTDGGWSEASIFDWKQNSLELEIFRLDDGRIGGIGKFDNIIKSDGVLAAVQIDMSNYPVQDYLQPSPSRSYVKCEVEEILFLDPFIPSGVRAVVSFDNPIFSNLLLLENVELVDANGNKILPKWRGGLLRNAPQGIKNNIYAARAFVRNFRKKANSDVTQYGSLPAAVMPLSVAIPLKSTNLTYGPWKAIVDGFSNYVPNAFGSGIGAYTFGTAGKTELEVNPDLNPWTFGSIAKMNQAASIFVKGKISKQELIETGSVTVPGAPSYQLGRKIVVDGPEITNISMRYVSDSVTTTYEMRTYTPDYKSLSQVKYDSLKRHGSMSRQIQNMRNDLRLFKIRGSGKIIGAGVQGTMPEGRQKGSSHPFIFGDAEYNVIPTGSLHRHEVSSDSDLIETDTVTHTATLTDMRKAMYSFAAGSGEESFWHKQAGMELIGLLRPYTTTSGNQSLMPELYRANRDLTAQNQFSTTPTCPSSEYNYANHYVYMHRGPVMGEGCPPIVAATLNPFLQPSGNTDDGLITTLHKPQHMMRFVLGSGAGHDIEYIIRDGSYPLDLSVLYPSGNYSESNWYRGFGVKSPLVLVGWGYDIYGKPVPNKTAPNGNPTAYFADNWLQKPHLWKAGPLDVRWDDSRGVWVSAPSYRIVKIKFLQNMLGYNNSINAEIVAEDLPKAYSPDGSGLANKYIIAKNPMGYASISGAYAWAFYDPSYNNKTTTYNYDGYQVLFYDNPTFTIKTVGGGSGVIISANPSFPPTSSGVGYGDLGRVYINNACTASGYTYICRYGTWSDMYQRTNFDPIAYPNIVEAVTLIAPSSARLDYNYNQVVPVINNLGIPAGVCAVIEWNDTDNWIVVNSQPFNTPVVTVI